MIRNLAQLSAMQRGLILTTYGSFSPEVKSSFWMFSQGYNGSIKAWLVPDILIGTRYFGKTAKDTRIHGLQYPKVRVETMILRIMLYWMKIIRVFLSHRCTRVQIWRRQIITRAYGTYMMRVFPNTMICSGAFFYQGGHTTRNVRFVLIPHNANL